MKADDGVAPAVAVALLISLVAVAGAIIGLTMFAALEDATGTLPDVRFQVSADGKSLYHAGGDALPLKNLVFYDTASKNEVDISLIKSGSAESKKPVEGDLWETGDRILVDGGQLDVLSIVGLDSRNRPALLYLGADAVVLPVGDMVPDEWIVTPPKPSVVPTPQRNEGDVMTIFQKENAEFTFGSDPKIELIPLINSQKLDIEYSLPNKDTSVEFKAQWSKYEWTNITVTVYNNETGDVVYTDVRSVQKNNKMETITIPSNILEKGYVCHLMIEIWKDKTKTEMSARQTVVITFI